MTDCVNCDGTCVYADDPADCSQYRTDEAPDPAGGFRVDAPQPEKSRQEVQSYLDAYSQMQGLDKSVVHTVCRGGEFYELRTEDLAALVGEVRRLGEALQQAQRENERISGAWAEVVQREQRAKNASFHDENELRAELAELRAKVETALETNYQRAIHAAVAKLHEH